MELVWGFHFSINSRRKADNQRIEFDVSTVPARTVQGREAADVR